MLKYFVFSLYLVLLAWQVFCDEPADTLPENDDDDFGDQILNDTDTFFVPQPRIVQVRSSEKSYTLNFRQVNWHTARELCTAQNQVLASVKSLEDNAGVFLAFIKNAISLDESFWIGASDLGHIGRWNWVSTGQPVGYSNWNKYPPNDYYWNANCAEILGNGQWNSNDCDLLRPFVCEDLPACP